MLVENPNEPWSNWAGNEAITPYMHCHAQTLQDLITIVQQAEGLGKRVRAVGSSWSFTDVAITDDFLVETDQLSNVLNTVLSTALNPRGASLQLVHVEAGMKVLALCDFLDSQNLALKTMGGSDGQSVAGILSTSVHGPDFDRGPVPDMVRAVHLVGPGGAQHWVEPSVGITDPVALQRALGIGPANIHYDDRWFNAAITTVGTLGMVYSVILEVQTQYDLVQVITKNTWPATRALLVNGTPFQPPNRCVQIVVDPSAPHDCYLYARTEGAPTGPAPYELYNDPLGLFCTTALADAIILSAGGAFAFLAAAAPFIALLPPPLDVIFGTLLATGAATATEVAPLIAALSVAGPGALGDVVAAALNGNPTLTAQAVTLVTSSNIPVGIRRGWAHTIMSGPNPGQCVARGLALEMAFDANTGSHLSFMDEVLPALDRWFTEGLALAGWFSLRFVGRSRAYLAPQNRCDLTCMAEITGLRGMSSTVPILDWLEALGRKHGGIQHWGMFRDLTKADVQRAYPNLNNWLRVRWDLTRHSLLRTFDNDFSVRVGLSDAPKHPSISYLEPLLLSEAYAKRNLSYLDPLLLSYTPTKSDLSYLEPLVL
jgi:FAD/FMN-containing dehydrogenase